MSHCNTCDEEHDVIVPMIHLNGTSAADLLEGYEAAWMATGKVRDLLAKAGPNARDYYPYGGNAWEQARGEHESRLQELARIALELGTIIAHVHECGRLRKRA